MPFIPVLWPRPFPPAVVPDFTTTIIPNLRVEADLPMGWTDITADVFAGQVEIEHGIRGSAPTELVASAGICTLQMLNHAGGSRPLGYYSPRHANVRTGWKQGIGLRVSFQDPATSVWHLRFIGRIDSIQPEPGSHLSRKVTVRAVDWFDDAARAALVPATIGEQVEKRFDEVLAAVIASMTRQPTAMDIDEGREVYPIALDDVTGKVAATFPPLAASEFGRIYQKADGTLRGEGRHVRLLSQTSLWTLTDADIINSTDSLSVPASRDDIVTVARTVTHDRVIDPVATRVLYQQTGSGEIFVTTGQVFAFDVKWTDQVTGEQVGATDVQQPIPYTDYKFISPSGNDQTTEIDVVVSPGPAGGTVTVTNGGGDGRLMGLRIVGRAIFDRGERQHESRAAVATIEDLGEIASDLDMRYQANHDVGQYAALAILNVQGTPFDEAQQVSVFGSTPAKLTQILTRDISDRITVQETVTGVDGDFFINAVRLTLLPSGHVTATYTLAPARNPFGDAVWTLNESEINVDAVVIPF